MIDRVETLIQAKDVSEATFRDLIEQLGAPDRLDFTVIGPAVNEVARIAAMCRSLDQDVLLSSAFAGSAETCAARLVSVGRYALRGVGRPQELFTLDPEAVAGGKGACALQR